MLEIWLYLILSAICGGKWVFSWEEASHANSRDRTSLSLTSYLPKMKRKRETGVETLLAACHAAVETSLAVSRKSRLVSWSNSPREQSEAKGDDAVMEDGTETRQAEINKKIKANDKLRTILTNKSDRQTEKLSGASLERDRIETEETSGNPAKNGSRLIRNWKQPTLNRYTPNKRWREQSAENARTVNQGNPRFQSHMSGSISDQVAQHTVLSVSSPFSRCKAWSATVSRNSSWRLAQPRRMSRKSARLLHRQCGHWRQGSRPLNLVPRRTASRAKWWARTKSSPMENAYLDSAKWTPKDKKPSRGACQTPSQERGDWRRNANRKEEVCSLHRLWIWIQIIAVRFLLSFAFQNW